MKHFLFIIALFTIFGCQKEIEKSKIVISENSYYDKAFEFLDAKKQDSAFLYFSKAKDLFFVKKDSLGVGKSLINMAIIQEQYGDNFGGQETGLFALNYLKEKDSTHQYYLATDYNTLGIICYNLKDYDNAEQFYLKAIHFIDNEDDKRTHLNNLANLYKIEHHYKKADSVYRKLLSTNKNHDLSFARISTNYAELKTTENPNYNPLQELHIALNIRKRENDLWGQNSSYSHLSNYYTNKNQDSARFYALQMLDIAKKINSPDDKVEAFQKLIIVDPARYSTYFKEYQKLSDSMQTVRSKAKNQFALIRFETEKNKRENISLQKENLEKKFEIIKHQIIAGILILLIIALLGVLYFWNKRKKRLKIIEKQKILESEREKFSKKIHDEFSNDVYNIMSTVENKTDINKPDLLNKLEIIYNKSRDLSRDFVNENFTKDYYPTSLLQMLNNYNSANTKVLVIKNDDATWQNVSEKIKKESFIILQELLINMKKHSQASLVAVKFERINHELSVHYNDNGIGIKENSLKNGLHNVEIRIKSLGGKLIFDKNLEKGTKISFSIPIN